MPPASGLIRTKLPLTPLGYFNVDLLSHCQGALTWITQMDLSFLTNSLELGRPHFDLIMAYKILFGLDVIDLNASDFFIFYYP
jgi:hypothetical protein